MNATKPPHAGAAWPYRDTARFDGLQFRTDPIRAPRRDRVIPIFEEEQIGVCHAIDRRRIMQRQARSSGKAPGVLDIGTGSGVLGIWAAAHGCRVVAIDINPRAINCARQNMNYGKNLEKINKSNGAIEFEVCSIERFSRRKSRAGFFDIILMNPPFNPTAPIIQPAQHADGGPDGMRAFHRQLPLAWKLLGEGGVIVGCQMILHSAGQASNWWSRTVKQLTSGEFAVAYASLLRTPECPAEMFLNNQYRSLLKSNSGPKIREYIEKTLRSVPGDPVFGFYFFEIRKLGRGGDSSVQRFKLSDLPSTEWSQRIDLHRIVVETSIQRR